MLKLFNYLSRKVEEFKPISGKNVGMYTCGPTVYDFTHIGHARTYIFADILQRVLEINDFEVKRAMNITDVGHLTSDSDTGEDKMEKGAERENKSVWEIAEFYTKDFFENLDALNIKRPEIICKATDHIAEMVDLIMKLDKRGFTYKIGDGVYFDTSKFPKYGQLTGQTFDSLQKSLRAGARVEVVEGKKNPTDFALWKLSPSGVKRQMEWDSPWGKGFPGWHIECSAMSMKYLGETFDIHTGGIDHVSIHHTNEIAQSVAATGKEFARFFLEGEHLLVEEQKMSKSLGDFYRVVDLKKKGFEPLAFRYLVLTAHYRSRLNFTWESIEGAQNALSNLRAEIAMWDEPKIGCSEFEGNFKEAINNDLDMPKAIANMWEMVKSDYPTSAKHQSILVMDKVLGLGLDKVNKAELSKEAKDLIKKREGLRKAGKFAESDELRQKLLEMGVEVEDTSDGPRWKISK